MNKLDVSTHELIYKCQQERTRYIEKGEESSFACIELFRRAFYLHDEEAWSGIYQIFKPLMKKWISAQNIENLDDILQEAFIKFARYAPQNFNLLTTERLGWVLSYLRECVRTSVVDMIRYELSEKIECHQFHQADSDSGLDAQRIDQQRLIRYIQDQLKYEEERIAFTLRFEFDVKPAVIAREYPHLFVSAKAVSTVVERIKLRLKRDPIISQLLDGLEF